MENTRKFKGADSFLIETAFTFHALLQKEIALFNAFDTTMNLAYAAEFKTTIDNCLSFGTDETLGDVMAQYTQEVMESMKKCQSKYSQIKYFAEKAFPTKKPAQDEFGTKSYKTARYKQDSMVVFMTALHTVAEKYKVQLFGQGATQAQLDEILTLRNQLLSTINEQEVFIRARATVTFDRIELLNHLYNYVEKICQAAQIIHYDNDAAKSMYVYLPGTYMANRTKKGTAAPGATTIAKLNYRANRTFKFTNTGTQPLLFGLSNDPTLIEGKTIEVPPGQSQEQLSEQLFVGGKFVVCLNQTEASSSYKVKYES